MARHSTHHAIVNRKSTGRLPANMLLFTGARATFKSTQRKILELCANSPSVLATDTSLILNHHKEQGTPIGKTIRALEHHMNAGNLLHGSLVFDAIRNYLDHMDRTQIEPIHYFILAGGARTIEEGRLLLGLRIPIRVVHLTTTFDDVQLWAQKRRDDGDERPDTNPAALRKSWDEYQKQVLPTVEMFKSLNRHSGQSVVLELPSSMPPLQRTREIIEFMGLQKEEKVKWLKRLDNPNHPARKLIDKVTPPQGKATPVATRDVVPPRQPTFTEANQPWLHENRISVAAP